MRYTLSVLTAACLLALGQPAWSSSRDQDLQQRARFAALSLPATDRSCATQLLRALQAQKGNLGRPMRFNQITAAVQQVLLTHYAAALRQQPLPCAMVELHWVKTLPRDLYARPALQWAQSTLDRRSQALVAYYLRTVNSEV